MVDKKDLLEENVTLDVDLGERQPIAPPLVEEGLQGRTELVESGSVLVSKKVFEETARQKTRLTEEEVVVERKELNEYVDVAPPPVRQEGNVTIVSVVKEVLVVEKRLMLVEELHITKNKKESVVPVQETLRREVVSVSQTDIGTNFEPLW